MQSEPKPNIPHAALPALVCPLDEAAIVARLDEAARRGKLPGFAGAPMAGVLFTITDFGTPFESVLVATAHCAEGVTRVTFKVRLKPLMPAVFAAALVVTVWPGVWLTDSLLRTYSSWYMSLPDWATYAWYLPLTAPFCPPAFMAAVRRSRAAAAAEARELIDKVASLLGARTEGA